MVFCIQTLFITDMKSLQIVFFGVAMIASASFSFGQDKPKKLATTSFEVSGVCGMCEQRIEGAALIKGVKFADWDRTTQQLKVVYKTKKVDLATIQQAIAEVGHDAGDIKAADTTYQELPGCCLYRDGLEVH